MTKLHKSEGDINISARRLAWQKTHIDAESQTLLDEDVRYFLKQSLSTPCLNTMRACEGIYIEDLQGRRYMDFHGNNVHQVGFGNPDVLDAVIEAGATGTPDLWPFYDAIAPLPAAIIHGENSDLLSTATVEEMAELLVARLESALPGEWILGGGWDEGAWANNLPVKGPLDTVSPDHPVVLLGRRGFGLLANSKAFSSPPGEGFRLPTMAIIGSSRISVRPWTKRPAGGSGSSRSREG